MKKVIVFRVENVLVRDYDELKMFDLKKKRLVKEMLKKEGVELNENDWEGIKMGVEELKNGFEEKGDVEKKLKMRDVLKRMEEMEKDEGEERMEMRRKFMDVSFEKRKISVRGDLEDLERVKGLVGDMRIVFVSRYGKMRVMRLLKNNGLRDFEVMGGLNELEGEEKEKVVMFGCEEDVEKMEEMGMRCVLGLKEMWKESGWKRAG